MADTVDIEGQLAQLDANRLIKPISTAPLDGRWVLARDPSIKYPQSFHGPWVIASRSDQKSGWSDGDGNEVDPTDWAPLPDPQPEPTKWLPVEGIICIAEITGNGWTDGKGNPVAVSWRWQIFIERSDGSYDEYRECDFTDTLEEAKAKADRRWVDRYHLPVVVRPLDDKVVALRPKPKRLAPPDGPEAA